MKKKVIIIIVLAVFLSLFLSLSIGLAAIGILQNLPYSMKHLPEGELLSSSVSPEGQYRVDAYLSLGNATTDFAVRCAVVEIATGEERNIYWEYHQQTVDIEWTDETTVVINGRVLNVLTDSYDWRSE